MEQIKINVNIKEIYNGKNKNIIYMFQNIGYLLHVIKSDEFNVDLNFYINKDLQLHDGVRIFNLDKILQYKDIISMLFYRLTCLNKIKFVDTIIHLGDFPIENTEIFTFCKNKNNPNKMIYSPDVFQFLYKQNQYQDQDYLFDWNSKFNKVIFRGSLTGDITSNNPRLLSLLISTKYPQYIDSKLTYRPVYYLFKNRKYVSYKINTEEENNYLSLVEQTNYKFILLIDGFVSPWRTIWALHSHSCILKVDSKYVEKYYDELIPGVHYISIKEDLSDLIEKVKWCLKNDLKCKQIADNAHTYAINKFTEENILTEMAEILSIPQDTDKLLGLQIEPIDPTICESFHIGNLKINSNIVSYSDVCDFL